MFDVEVSVVSGASTRGRRTRYAIQVVLPHRQWMVERRHVEFRRLFEALQACGFALAAVPARRLWGPRTASALERRVESLDIWLHGALATWKTAAVGSGDKMAANLFTKFLCQTDEFVPESVSGARRASLFRGLFRKSYRLAFRRFWRGRRPRPASPPPLASRHGSTQPSPAVGRYAQADFPPPPADQAARNDLKPDVFAAGHSPVSPPSAHISADPQFSPRNELELHLFHGAVQEYSETDEGLFTITMLVHGPDMCANGFSSVSVPPSPKGRVLFAKSWAAYTDTLLKHVARRLEMSNVITLVSSGHHSAGNDDSAWQDSASEGASENEGANPQVDTQRRQWLSSAIRGPDADDGTEGGDSERDGYDSEGWASEAANASYDGGDSEVYGSWDAGQVWVVSSGAKRKASFDEFEDEDDIEGAEQADVEDEVGEEEEDGFNEKQHMHEEGDVEEGEKGEATSPGSEENDGLPSEEEEFTDDEADLDALDDAELQELARDLLLLDNHDIQGLPV